MEVAVDLTLIPERPLTEDQLFSVAELGAVVGEPGGSRLEVTFVIDSDSLYEAMPIAIKRVITRVPGSVVSVAMMTAEENDRRCNEQPPAFVGITEIGELLGVSKQRVFQLLDREDFPAPYATLECGRIWRKGDLSRFAEGWQRKPGRPAREARA